MSRRIALVAVPALLLVLTGCVPTAEPGADPTPTPTATIASPSPTPSPTLAVTPTPGPDTVPVTFGCSDILSAQAIYDYNPNVSLLSTFSPDAGTLAGDAVAQQGIACRLINQTSGATIDIGVVSFTDAGYTSKVADVESNATSTGAFDGYFDVANGTGVAQGFSTPYWFTVTSADFLEAGDSAALVEAIAGSLP